MKRIFLILLIFNIGLNLTAAEKNSKESNPQEKKISDINKDLLIALSKNNLNLAKIIIQSGKADLNTRYLNGMTVLIWAVYKNDLNLVKASINAGADLNAKDKNQYTALIWAAYNGKIEIVKTLVAAGAKLDLQNSNGRTALMWAVSRRFVDIMKLLIESGAKIDIKNKYNQTASNITSDNVIRKMISDYYQNFIKSKYVPADVQDNTTKQSNTTKNTAQQNILTQNKQN